MERSGDRSKEETNQLARSTKKMKRDTTSTEDPPDEAEFMAEDIDTNLLMAQEPNSNSSGTMAMDCQNSNENLGRRSYRDMVQQNNPHLNFSARVNPIWESDPVLRSI